MGKNKEGLFRLSLIDGTVEMEKRPDTRDRAIRADVNSGREIRIVERLTLDGCELVEQSVLPPIPERHS